MHIVKGAKDRTVFSLPTPADGPKSPFVLVLSGIAFGEVYRLHEGRVAQLGRAEEAQIQLDDEGVSRTHCSLEVTPQGTVLRDLGSHNGTFVGGERVTERLVRDGEHIRIGAGTVLKYCYANATELDYQRRMAEIALRDPLTAVFNRRHFRERLEAEFAAARRHRRPLTALLVDIDQLRNVNEAAGRGAGDEVLRAVAKILLVRGSDVVGRVGGDELAVLLRETDLKGGQQAAARLIKAVRETRIQHEGRELSVTATVGIVAWLPEQAGEADDFFQGAGRALDRMKELGGNRAGN